VRPVRFDLHGGNPRAVGLEGGVARGDMDRKAAFEKRGQFGVNRGEPVVLRNVLGYR
jgi:hypothetical protein